MHQHKFFILRGRARVILAQLFPAQRTVNQTHRDGLAFGLAKYQSVAARKLRRFRFAAFELVHGFAFRQLYLAHLDRESQFRNVHFHRHHANAQFTDKSMGAPKAALR